ncbi:BTAD domain-containing putative transcriptional regulator [Kitasatospora sp. NPDC094015]|uniref:AfsR/SARP family transcriptional regulator n=1 Tax=Kitasatospora sp. NPDC094015 TaxID=3155205 RepID=UPI003324B999
MRINLLAGVELRRADGTEVPVATPKRRALLTVLALELNRVVPTDRLVEALWGSEPPPTARAALQGHVAALRKQLDGEQLRLVTREPGYVLTGGQDAVDAHEFDSLVASSAGLTDPAAAAVLRAALALWPGPWEAEDSPSALPDQAARSLRETRLRALERLAEALLRLDRAPEVLDELAAAVAVAPRREPVVALLMLCLDRAGRAGEALAVYRRTVRRLEEELGIGPGRVLLAAHRQIGSAPPRPARPEPVRRSAVPCQLPRASRGFAGRAADLARIDEAVDRPGRTAVLVCGAAGVGKTSLVLQWAHRNTDRFPDGRLYVDLRGFDESGPVDPREALGGLLRALDVADEAVPASLAERSELFRRLVAGRRMLVVLDNVRESAQAAPLYADIPEVLTLVTSRSRLQERPNCTATVRLTLDVLAPADALDLLARVVDPARLAAEPHAARRIVELCDGLPLALRIAAARLASRPDWALAELAAELADEQTALPALSTGGALGVASALALSCRALSAPAARLFALLGLHAGREVCPQAAAALGGLAADEAAGLLAELGAAHLVEQPEPGLFGRHDLVRLYTRELTDTLAAPERRAAVDRLLDYYLATCAALTRALGRPRLPVRTPGPAPSGGVAVPGGPAEALELFRREERAIRTLVVEAGRDGHGERVWQLAYEVAPAYYHDGGFLPEWERLARSALAAAEQAGSLEGRVWTSGDLGMILGEQGRHAEQAELMERALPLAERLGRRPPLVRCLSVLAEALYELGGARGALPLLERMVEMERAAGDGRSAAVQLNNLAECRLTLGEPRPALAAAEESVALLAGRTDPALAISLGTLAEVRIALGLAEQALEVLLQALELDRELRDHRMEAQHAEETGLVLQGLGRGREARAYYLRSLEVLDRHGRPLDGIRARLAALGLGPDPQVG